MMVGQRVSLHDKEMENCSEMLEIRSLLPRPIRLEKVSQGN